MDGELYLSPMLEGAWDRVMASGSASSIGYRIEDSPPRDDTFFMPSGKGYASGIFCLLGGFLPLGREVPEMVLWFIKDSALFESIPRGYTR